MLISLELLRNSPGETFTYTFIPEATELDLSEDGTVFEGPLQFSLNAEYHDGKIHLSGRLHAKVVLACSRCLRTFTCLLNGEYEDDVPVEDSAELNVAEMINEAYYAAFPLKPLCNTNCKGLCTVCGEDRNEKDCCCHVDDVDHRLSVLKKLLQE